MNLELDFSLPPARAHRDDPVTSRQAAARMNCGKAAAQREQVFELIKSRPGCTTAELAELFHVDRSMLARRAPELRERGLVENREPRLCRVNQTMAIVWWPREGA